MGEYHHDEKNKRRNDSGMDVVQCPLRNRFSDQSQRGKIKSTLSIARLEISTGALAALETGREVVFRVSTEEFHVPVTDEG